MTTWEERMGDRGRALREEAERLASERAEAEYATWLAGRRDTFLAEHPEPPNGCTLCYRIREHPSFGDLGWWHVWPETQPFEDWTCRHECHGPSGKALFALGFA